MPLKPIFDPKTECVCRKAFVVKGKQFEAGDPFPWFKMGIPELKAKKMYHAGYFCLSDDPALEGISIKKVAPPLPAVTSYKELQAQCKEAGMNAAGTTEELTARLGEYKDMQDLCKEKGLDTSGTMEELEARYDADADAGNEDANANDAADEDKDKADQE